MNKIEKLAFEKALSALNSIACWSSGTLTVSMLDEPCSAVEAREAIREISKILGKDVKP